MSQKSTVDSAKKLAWLTLAICAALFAIPYIAFHKELAVYNKLWYFVALQIAFGAASAFFLIKAFANAKGEDDANKPKVIACGIAVVMAITLLATGAAYRSDKSDNIAPAIGNRK